MMDHALCNVVYLDRTATRQGLLRADDVAPDGHTAGLDSEAELNIRTLLSVLDQVYVCADGISCLDRIARLEDAQSMIPTLVFLDIPLEEKASLKRPSAGDRTPSPTDMRHRVSVEQNEPDDLYGSDLLSYLSSEIHQRLMSKLIIPIALLNRAESNHSDPPQAAHCQSPSFHLSAEPGRLRACVDAGAADVLTSPLTPDRVQGLATHVYRVSRDVLQDKSGLLLKKRNRKLSWMGINEERPFAYLREVMVSGLMEGICNPESIGDGLDSSELDISEERKRVVETVVGEWSFSAHAFTSDELLYCALTMLEHALQIPALEQWRMTRSDLTTFLTACRNAYNDFVLYHNFRHVVDVLQAVFFFLLQIGALPPYPNGGQALDRDLAPIAVLLKPFDALTLLVAAIGHDVGHPGVNNAFLVALNAPLAQLYNDRSVLEAFHCAAYSQILRRYWPAAFADIPMRKLMINSILATDMGLHFKFIMDMGNLQEKLAANGFTTDGWSPKVLEEARDLTCGLLIKCADISNIARKFDVAAQWAYILTDEFTNQGAMEKELSLPTCLFGGPPDRDDLIKMAESQLGFMNIFAKPLFEGVTDILPAMIFSIEELSTNKQVWEMKMEAERGKRRGGMRGSEATSVAHSPMTRSIVDLKNPHPAKDELVPRMSSEKDSFFSAREVSENLEPAMTPSSEITLMPKSDDRRRSSAMTNNSYRGGSRRTSALSGAVPPVAYSNTFTQAYSPSRRSSKDLALEELEHLQSNQSINSGRRGSGDASLATMAVRSQEHPSPSKTPSPEKRGQMAITNSRGSGSLPVLRNHASSHPTVLSSTTASTPRIQSPSTTPSSLGDNDGSMSPGAFGQYPIAALENPFLHPNISPEIHARNPPHASAPDILDRAAASPGKASIKSGVTSDGQDSKAASVADLREDKDRKDLRESRSRSRLRGLKFWRKRWKSPDMEIDEGSSA